MHTQLFEDADLLAMNAGQYECGFALCTRSGFADSMRSPGDQLPSLDGVRSASPSSVHRGLPKFPNEVG